MSDFYPIFLKIKKKPVLVVGGGKVAERKINSLLEYGAKIFVVSKELTKGLRELVDKGKIEYLGKDFLVDQLDEKLLVIVATDDPLFNRYVAQEAEKKGILVNVADQPADCSFIVPSILKRGDLVIAISTSGKSPFLAKKIREELESKFGSEYRIFLEIFSAIRSILIESGKDQKEKILERLYNSDMLNKIRERDIEGMVKIINDLIC